jgi:hypothetical protein
MPRLVAALILLAAAGPLAQAQSVPRLQLLDTAVLRAPRLVESSGLAPSTRAPGVLWTHNDGGDQPRLYATDSAGHDLGSVLVAGARNVDWEDMAAAPCPAHDGPCLYVGDIGDNGRSRRRIVVYWLREPAPPDGPGDTAREVPIEAATALRYPDRRHDAEALIIEPTGRIAIITKELGGLPMLFRAPPRSRPQRPGEVDILRPVGPLDIPPSLTRLRLVTGAAVSPDGTILAVRTYSSLHFFRLRGDSLPAPLTPPAGLVIPVIEPQGEAVTFTAPDRLILTTERDGADHAIISRLRVTGLPRHRP